MAGLETFLFPFRPITQWGVDFLIKIPIFRIGVAASNFLPTIAKRIHTSVSLQDNSEVGYAFGVTILG